jgi:predicted PurR-regulated permease PerM
MRRQIYDYFFLLLLFFAFYGIGVLVSPFGGALLAAGVCSIAFYPLYQAIRRWFPRLGTAWQAFIADVFVFVFFVTPMVLLAWAIVQESSSLVPMLKGGSSAVAQWREGNVLESAPWMADVRFFLAKAFGVQRAQFQGSVIHMVNTALETVSHAGTLLAKNAAVFLVDLLIMLFALYFLFRDGEKLFGYVQNLIPMRRENKNQLVDRVHQALIGIVRGVLLTSVIQGVLAAVGYMLVGADGAILLGALTSLSALVPVIGTLAIWVPAGVFYCLKGFYLKGGFLLLWGAIVIVGVMDTVVRPYLMSKKAEQSMAVLFFALLGGVQIWGAKGIILGPLVASLLPVLLEIYRQRYLRQGQTIETRVRAESELGH